MPWWLFLPIAYLAMGFDLVCANELAFRGTPPAFLLLLWSVLAVRSRCSRTMMQACLLGIVADLSTGHTLGVAPAVFVIVIFLLGLFRKEESSHPLTWFWWSIPLMFVTLVAIHAGEWLLQPSEVSPRLLLRHSMLTVTVTFGWGLSFKLAHWILRQLFRFPSNSAPRELEASSFFLSR